MTRKKVAILLPWLKMGGTNKVALRFMAELSEYCDVTLILSRATGELMDQIPESVRLVVDEITPFPQIFRQDLRHFRLGKLLSDIKYYSRIKTGRDNVDNYRYLARRCPCADTTCYDCAISFHGQSPELLVSLLDRIHAVKKLAWIHGEFSNTTDHYRRMERLYRKLDGMFFVSHHTREAFLAKMNPGPIPTLVYYNPLDAQEILTQAQLPCQPPMDPQRLRLVTVGRISREKGQDMIPAIARNLLDLGYPIQWYVIGDGPARQELEAGIRRFRVADHVTLLGVRTNPYCYIKDCHVYVQPSYTEGYCTTICEAGILGKAIVGTEPSGGIREQITSGEDGLIVEATVEGLTQGIRALLEDPALRQRFSQNIQKKNFSGTGEIQKFLDLLGVSV